MDKKRVLSGIRATGRLHLGNYLGAVKGFLQLQDNPEYECFYMVADLHTITTPFKVEELRNNRKEVVLDYLAAGLDPEKVVIFEQSDSLHAELAFYLSSVVSIARMQHLPTYKDKVKQHPSNSTMALLNYPVLMAADILIYKASLVPVGIDQEPHLEIAREIARKMNETYGTDFPEPQRFATKGEYVPSLTGEGKMSKSVEGSFINLTDDLETIKSKLAKVPTDSGKAEGKGFIRFDFYVPAESVKYGIHNLVPAAGVRALLNLVALFQGEEKKKEYQEIYQDLKGPGLSYKQVKEGLAKAIYKELQPIQEKREELSRNSEYVDKVLEDGAEKARKVARETIEKVKERMGFK